jgi:protein TonB
MRFFPALCGAFLITIAVFLFMQSLIQRGRDEGARIIVHQDVQILRREEHEEEPEPEPDTPQVPPDEPQMDALPNMEVSPPSPQPATDLELPALDLGMGDIKVQAGSGGWSAPLAAGDIAVIAGGKDAQGFVEVVPFNTRRPNVPEVAWQNKINGWVLVAFNVTPQGDTRNIRVLDAKPRGVFEEKVIAAVEDWTYRVSFSGQAKGNLVLTQKVEVQWENYSLNMPNVD